MCQLTRIQSHEDPAVRVGACWVMINWTWPNPNEPQDGKNMNFWIRQENVFDLFFFIHVDLITRCARLNELGVKKELETLVKDSNTDVVNRAKTALNQLCSVIGEIPEPEI